MLDQVHGYPSIEVYALPHAGNRTALMLCDDNDAVEQLMLRSFKVCYTQSTGAAVVQFRLSKPTLIIGPEWRFDETASLPGGRLMREFRFRRINIGCRFLEAHWCPDYRDALRLEGLPNAS